MTASGLSAAFRGRFGAFELDAAFSAPGRGVTALFGRSGSGKTTILRSIAGLARLAGHLSVGDEVWQGEGVFKPAHRREVGYVFQEASLFPHLSVRDNLLYGHRRALKGGSAERIRFGDVVDLLDLDRFLGRDPAGLSGGERQRVAVGRALLSQPRLLLMDEPLSGLDRDSKDEILPYFEALHAALAISVLYVSHDLVEVERLADHLVLVDAGKVAAEGPLADLLIDTRLPFARRAGMASIVTAVVRSYDSGDRLCVCDLAGETLLVPGPDRPAGTGLRLRIAASDVSLAVTPPSRTTILNVVPARVEEVLALADGNVSILLSVGNVATARLVARITRRSLATFGFTPGQAVFAQIKGVSLLAAPLGGPPDNTPPSYGAADLRPAAAR